MDMIWALVLLVLVGALVYGAYALGRASAFAEMRRGEADQEPAGRYAQDAGNDAPVPSARANPPRTAAAPPVLAGGEDGPSGSATSSPRRNSVSPPAAAASSSNSSGATSGARTPRRTSAPPPAAAAWSTPKPGSDGNDA